MNLTLSLVLVFRILCVAIQSLILMRIGKRLVSFGDDLIANLKSRSTKSGQS